ncbi:MAG: hypothetical protein ACYTHK_01225 [Planctomycetota bacterium]|jgi:hypothetical protein
MLAWIEDRIDLAASRGIDTAACQSVCLTLGPYRNLTTLTASVLFLHPHCQVLNHAGARIFGRKQIDFLTDYSKQRLDRFIQYAIRISIKGTRGDHGGSIVHSHAFDEQHGMKELFEQSGGALRKQDVRCLFWKESLRTSNRLRDRGVDPGKIFAVEPRLRFLMPVRNPMDCAVSNCKTGYAALFRGLGADATEQDVTLAILDEIRWFADLAARYPGRFFCYYEHSVSREVLVELAEFLGLEPLEAWLDAALAAMKLKPGYDHAPELIEAYRRGIDDRFADHPEMAEALHRFVAGS